MKLVVFGSTGGIGRHVVEQALQAGHTVTAIARRPEAIALHHEHLRVVKGDALQPGTFASVITNHDAVVSALGVPSLEPTTLYSQGVANIMQAMQALHIKRLICVSASGLETGNGTPLWQKVVLKVFLQRILRESYADLLRMESLLRASSLDWTSLRPPRLTNGPRTGHFQVAPSQRHQTTASVSRADVAACILACLADDSTYRAWAELARK